MLLGVYAYKVVDDKLDLRYSPSPDAFKINSGSYIEGASESEEITPSQFEQYMQAMNDGLNKVEESLKKMDEATSSANDLVDNINQKLENGDFIGPEGTEGPQGVPGTNGKDGVGITTITSGQSTVEEDKTITPVTVQKSDGSSQSFKVEAKNGIDGQNGQNGKDGVNGQDGLTPSIGENGNWFIGDTDTGKPSRGEVGPSPDLTDYVKNTDYASYSKGGVIKTDAYSVETDSNGFLRGKILTKEQFVATGNSDIISKGTMENIKDDYVESSNPLITLNNTLDNLVRKNRVSDYIVSLKDALKYKVFEFLVHGKVKQESTTGKNLLFEIRNNYLVEVIDQEATTSSLEGFGNCKIGFKNSDGSTSINLDAGTYYISFDLKINSGNQSRALNLIAPSNRDGYEFISNHIPTANYQRYCASFTLNSSKEISDILIQKSYNDETCSFKIKNVMISSSSDYTYEPYTGGQPSPSPDYPQPITTLNFDKITRCGKNLATENFANQNSIINLARTLKKGEKITIVINMTKTDNPPSGYGINIYDQDNEQLWGNSYTNWQPPYDGWNSFVVTVKNDTNRLRINAYGYQEVEILTAILSGALVEENKYIHDGSLYEPYQGQTYDIDLQGNEMVELPNGVKDELVVDKYGNVSLIKNVSKVVYDGINKKVFVKHSSFVSDTKGFYLCTIDNKNKNFDSGYTKAIKCDSLIARSGNAQTAFNNYDSGIWWEGNTNNVYMILSLTTIDEVNNWLQDHNVTFYYQLENPEVIPLGKLTNLITTEEGINTFFINGNLETTLEVLYALDIKKYIDNKLAEISTAMIEEG